MGNVPCVLKSVFGDSWTKVKVPAQGNVRLEEEVDIELGQSSCISKNAPFLEFQKRIILAPEKSER